MRGHLSFDPIQVHAAYKRLLGCDLLAVEDHLARGLFVEKLAEATAVEVARLLPPARRIAGATGLELMLLRGLAIAHVVLAIHLAPVAALRGRSALTASHSESRSKSSKQNASSDDSA